MRVRRRCLGAAGSQSLQGCEKGEVNTWGNEGVEACCTTVRVQARAATALDAQHLAPMHWAWAHSGSQSFNVLQSFRLLRGFYLIRRKIRKSTRQRPCSAVFSTRRRSSVRRSARAGLMKLLRQGASLPIEVLAHFRPSEEP